MAAVDSSRTWRIGSDDLVEQLRSSSRERKLAGESFIEHHTQAVDITTIRDPSGWAESRPRACSGLMSSRCTDYRSVMGQMNRFLVDERQAEIDDSWFT